MIRYVKNIDELVEVIDREFSGANARCPVCKNKLGTVKIPDVELDLPELKFMEFKYPGVFCTQGHCIISFEEIEQHADKNAVRQGEYKLYVEDLGIKVFEVMKLIKPYLDIDEAIPNTQLYWVLMNKSNQVFTKGMSYEDAMEILDSLQRLGARAKII